jgi:uncharacterized membrane protein YheB (UPF0754 family)
MTTESPNLDFLKDELDSRLKKAMDFVSLIGSQLHEEEFTPEDKRVIVAGYLKLVTPKVMVPIESDVDVAYLKAKIVEDLITSTSKILIVNYSRRYAEVSISKTNEDLLPQLMSHWNQKGFTVEKRLEPITEKDCLRKTYYKQVATNSGDVIHFCLDFSW